MNNTEIWTTQSTRKYCFQIMKLKSKGVIFSRGCSKSKNASVRNEIWVSQVCVNLHKLTLHHSHSNQCPQNSPSAARTPAPPPPLIGWPTEVTMEICVVGQACKMKGADFEWPNPLWYNFICTQTQISDHVILVCMQWCSQTNKSQFLLLVSSWWYKASSDLYWEGDLCWPRHD